MTRHQHGGLPRRYGGVSSFYAIKILAFKVLNECTLRYITYLVMCRERKPSRIFSMNKLATIFFQSVHNYGTNMAAKCARIGKNNFLLDMHCGEYVSLLRSRFLGCHAKHPQKRLRRRLPCPSIPVQLFLFFRPFVVQFQTMR